MKKTEFKKILVAAFAIWGVLFVTVSGIFGLNETVSSAIIYGVLSAIVAYCAASATDKIGINKYLGGTRPDETCEKGEKGDDLNDGEKVLQSEQVQGSGGVDG